MVLCVVACLALVSSVDAQASAPNAATQGAMAIHAAHGGQELPGLFPCEVVETEEVEAHKRRAAGGESSTFDDCEHTALLSTLPFAGALRVVWATPFAEALRVAISIGLPRGPPALS